MRYENVGQATAIASPRLTMPQSIDSTNMALDELSKVVAELSSRLSPFLYGDA